MKKMLLAGIVILAMSMTAFAEENDDLDDEFSEESSPMEIIQDFMDDCNDHGDYYGCFSVAIKYEKGEVLEKDITKAIEYYGKACKLGSEEGCKMAKKLQEQAK
jgi:TPR repeat protein